MIYLLDYLFGGSLVQTMGRKKGYLYFPITVVLEISFKLVILINWWNMENIVYKTNGLNSIVNIIYWKEE